jgi:hypothetical protein
VEDIRVKFSISGSPNVSFLRTDEIQCKEVVASLTARLFKWEQNLMQTAASNLIKRHTNSEVAASIDVVYSVQTERANE